MPRAGFPGPLFPFAPEASEANGNNEALDGNTEALDGNTDANNASLGSKPRPRAMDPGTNRKSTFNLAENYRSALAGSAELSKF